MFGRFFKSKDDGKGGPPGHRQEQSADEPPVGGGFFNLPPPVAKPHQPAPSAGNYPSNSGTSQYPPANASTYPQGNASSSSNYPPGNSSASSNYPPGNPSTSSYGAPPAYESSPAPPTDMFGGMAVRNPPDKAGYQHPPPQQPQYGGFNASPAKGGSLFSGLDVASSGAATAPAPAAAPEGGLLSGLTVNAPYDRKAVRSTGSFNYMEKVTSGENLGASGYSRSSATSSTSATSRSSNKVVKKKKKKTFRPGFGRQLSDESAAALQRGDLKEDEVLQQAREGRAPSMSERSDSSRSSRTATNPTDLAHLLPPVKSGSVLQGLTVHRGSSSSGGGVLAGLTVHTSSSPSPAKVLSSEPETGGNGVLAGLNIRTTPSAGGDDVDEAPQEAPVEDAEPEVYEKPTPPVPAAPLTPEDRLFNTLRDFHASAVSFRQNTVKQNEEENRLLERKAQLAHQLTQYEMDLRDVEAQQHHACEVEDFEKADALNATINSVRHCITLTESDVRKVDSELVAFVKAKEKAFANQLKSTRGTLRELEKFREDQETERTDVRNEYKKYEANQTEQLQFEAERIDTEMHHVSVSLQNVIAEKSEIETTIEEQCSSEFEIQAKLIEEKTAVEEEVRELERKLKLKLERVQEIQESIDSAQRDIDTVRKRYSRQLKRIADREEGIHKTKAEVEADGEQLEHQRHEFQEQLRQYADDIAVIGKRIGTVKKEMRAASLLANVLEVQETRREQALIRKKQQTAELSSLNDAAAVAEQSFTMLSNQHEELEKSLSIHRNAIASAEAMIPRLEQEKKASAAQRNFKEAARISKDIKALEKDRSTAEEMVEVVEMELQDLTERIAKRQVEFEEKKKELKEMEKHLELATLQELWKEAKHLRTALRRIEKCKSEGVAADDGIDFRSSALLLVQAEYDACMLQVDTLEKKYDVTDPAKDEEEADDEDEDESINGDEEDSDAGPVVRSSLAGKSTDVEGSEADVEASEDSSSALETISAQLMELESQIEKATINEDYELAAKLDEKVEELKDRQRTLKASVSLDSGEAEYSNDDGDASSEQEAEESNDSEYVAVDDEEAEADYGHEEMVSLTSAVRSHDELTQSLESIQLQVVMLEKQIELATENEDYDTAATYDEELQSLRAEERSIREQLEPGSTMASANSANMFGELDVKVEEPIVNTQEADDTHVSDNEIETEHESPTDEVPQPATSSSSLFGGLQMSGGPTTTSESPVDISSSEPNVEEAVGHEPSPAAKTEVDSPTSYSTADMKDSFFGTPQAPDSSASMTGLSASGSLFGGLQMSGGFQVSSVNASPEKEAQDDRKSDDEAGTDAAGAEDSAAPVQTDMFGGLQLSSSGSGEASTAPSADMFGGLHLSSSAVGETPAAPASTEAPVDMFGGLQLSSSAVSATPAAPAVIEAPTDMFGGLQLSGSAVASAEAAEADGEAELEADLVPSSTKSAGDTHMSIEELSENDSAVVVGENEASFHSDAPTATSATMLSETTSTETTMETTSTTVVSTTTVTKLSDDDDDAGFEDAAQDATQP